MDKDIPKSALLFIMITALAAAFLVGYLVTVMDWSRVNWLPVLIFLFLIIISDSFPVTLPRGGSVTVSFAAITASIILFQPFVVIAIATARDFFLLLKGRRRLKSLFNVSQIVLCAGSSSLLYTHYSPSAEQFTVNHIPAVIISILILFVLNSVFVTLVLALTQEEKPLTIWTVNIKWTTLTFLSMAPLGALIAVIYTNIGLWALLLFLLPLILARYSFQSYMNMRQTFLDTIKSLSMAIDAKDPYTKGHSSRVAYYAVSLARELKWPEDKLELLHYIAIIHDVGKVSVPEHILKKGNPLTGEEHDIMKLHCREGAEIIKEVKYFMKGSGIIRHHHEHWDGTGYPDQIQGEDIPEGARILAVADAFDAMTTDRPYREAMQPEAALRELQKYSGIQFDPSVVDAFARIFTQLQFDNTEG